MKDKDYTEMVKELTESRLFTEISVVQIQSGRALSAQSIAETFRTYIERNIGEYHSVEKALEAAKNLRENTPGFILQVPFTLWER